MDARYVHRGDAIDFRPDHDISAGEVVVLGKLVGVAKLDIKAGELGSLALTGVYEMPKLPNQAFIGCGLVGWDAGRRGVTNPYVAGVAILGHRIKSPIMANEPTILVRLCQGAVVS